MRFDNSFSVGPGYKQSLVIVDGFMPSGVSLAPLWPELGWRIARVGVYEKLRVPRKFGFCENSSENRSPAVWGRCFAARCLPDAGQTIQVTRRADFGKNSSKSNIGTRANRRQMEIRNLINIVTFLEIFCDI